MTDPLEQMVYAGYAIVIALILGVGVLIGYGIRGCM